MEIKDTLTERIIACCFKVHTELGPGFNEKIYHNALKASLEENDLSCETEKRYAVPFHNKEIGFFRIDLIVEHKVIVEVKAITGGLPEVFKYQVLSYLKISDLNVGLLVNFGNQSCRVKRFML